MTNNDKLLNNIENNLRSIKEKSPLTHCITNFVTVNDCANAVLAIGASPIMSNETSEMENIETIADALVINIGTVTKLQREAMIEAAKAANKADTTIVLDPVGVGISDIRNETTLEIINNYKLDAIRGNITEVKTIATLIGLTEDYNVAKGVDVSDDDIITEDNLGANCEIIAALAKKLDTVILASGPIDILSDGETTITIDNGDEMMPLITGSGCMLSAILGSCIAGSNPLEGALIAILLMNVAGEKARAKVDEKDEGPNSFRSYLIDYLYKLDGQTLIENANIEIV